MKLDDQELNTVLAALRWYQHSGMGEPANRPDWLHEIATNGEQISMDAKGIDDLCERLNTDSGCDHNEMVATNDPAHAWKCAKCGHVYGTEEAIL